MADELRKPHFRALRWAIANWSVIFSGLFVQSGLNALTLIVVARNVTPFEYGLYLASFALASFAVILPVFGIDAWLLTQPRDSAREASALWLSATRSVALTLALWLVAMLLLATVLPKETYPPEILLPTLIGAGLDGLILIAFASLRSQGRHSLVAIMQTVASGSLLVIAVTLPLEESGAALFAVARALLSLVIAVVILALLGAEYRRQRGPLIEIRSILATSRPYFWSNLSSSTYVKADLTIISLALGIAGTSIYGPAINLLQASFLPSLAIFFLITPLLSKAFSGNWRTIASNGRNQLIAQAAIGLIIALVLFGYAAGIVDLVFGPGYEESAAILTLLSPVVFFRALNMGAAAIIMASGFQSWRTRVQVVVALFNVGGNILVVGVYGLVGVSVIYILSETALLLGQLYLLRRVRQRTTIASPATT
jgi:O-antigen/teichoic acid export membrane protein